jgi:membrane protease YdiL (CAAX protease family)
MVSGTISTFATPAIGAAYLSGNREVLTIDRPPDRVSTHREQPDMTTPVPDHPYLAAVSSAAATTFPARRQPAANHLRTLRSFVGRHPLASFLVAAYAIFWASWLPVLFLGAPPRLFSAIGAALGLALPAFLVTAATEGKVGVRDLVRRSLRWRVGIGWYLLAALAIPTGALVLAAIFHGLAPLQGFGQNWVLLSTAYVPQLLLALVTVQFFEELGWAGFMQHHLQARHGALKASVLAALAFAFLHLPTYLRMPISGQSAARDLSVLAIVIPFAIVFRILIAYTYNRTAHAVLIAAITHASFNEASELIAPNVQGSLAQILAFASTALLALLAGVVSKGTLHHYREQRTPVAGTDGSTSRTATPETALGGAAGSADGHSR